jgi:hypothetical protein
MSHPVVEGSWEEWSFEQRLIWTGRYLSTLDRRRREYRRLGWVYVMRNPLLKGSVFKVGQTRRWPWERAQDLSRSTSTIGEFQPVYFVHAGDRHAAESHAHRVLAGSRVTSNKEFFDAPLKEILEALDSAAAHSPVWIGRRDPQPLPQPFRTHRYDCPECGTTNLWRELLVAVRARCTGCKAELEP